MAFFCTLGGKTQIIGAGRVAKDKTQVPGLAGQSRDYLKPAQRYQQEPQLGLPLLACT